HLPRPRRRRRGCRTTPWGPHQPHQHYGAAAARVQRTRACGRRGRPVGGPAYSDAMPTDLGAATWVLDVTHDDLVRELGAITVSRAQGYAAEGRVRTLVCTPGGEQLLATVTGTSRQLYQTIVRRVGDGPDWVGRCSCPVSVDCKHAAAVLLTAQERLGGTAADASWETALAPLVRGAAHGPSPGSSRPP